MFIGHYAAAMIGRGLTERPPLWAFVAAAQMLDILWCLLVMAGIERVQPDPNVTEGLAFIYYPFSHSLMAAFFWSAIVQAGTRSWLRIDRRNSYLLAWVVLSHWPIDLLVHRVDLPLSPVHVVEFGLGLWNYPVVELALEILLFLAAGIFLLRLFMKERRPLWPLGAFLAFGMAAMAAMRMMPPPAPGTNAAAIGASALALYLLFIAAAWAAERPARASG